MYRGRCRVYTNQFFSAKQVNCLHKETFRTRGEVRPLYLHLLAETRGRPTDIFC